MKYGSNSNIDNPSGGGIAIIFYKYLSCDSAKEKEYVFLNYCIGNNDFSESERRMDAYTAQFASLSNMQDDYSKWNAYRRYANHLGNISNKNEVDIKRLQFYIRLSDMPCSIDEKRYLQYKISLLYYMQDAYVDAFANLLLGYSQRYYDASMGVSYYLNLLYMLGIMGKIKGSNDEAIREVNATIENMKTNAVYWCYYIWFFGGDNNNVLSEQGLLKSIPKMNKYFLNAAVEKHKNLYKVGVISNTMQGSCSNFVYNAGLMAHDEFVKAKIVTEKKNKITKKLLSKEVNYKMRMKCCIEYYIKVYDENKVLKFSLP
ncbi:MAG: hypothetical protein HZC28_13095 [Spirochaetes bacterium]|nr:hypothetical protein [Spirochaetota bacterium]